MQKETFDRTIKLLLASGALALTGLGFVARSEFRNLSDAADFSQHTRTTIASIEGLVHALLDAETGQRGYLLTSQPHYLDPYRSGTAAAGTQLQAVTQQLGSNAAQQALLARLNQLVTDKLSEMAQTITLHEQHQEDAALALVQRNDGQRLMDEIRSITGALAANAQTQLALHSTKILKARATTETLLHITQASVLLVLLGGFWLVRRELRHRLDSAQALRRSQDALLESEHRLSDMANALPVLIGYVDRNEIYRFTNAGYDRISGQEPNAYVGKSIRDLLGDAVYTDVKPRINAALAGHPQRFDRSSMRDGMQKHGVVTYTPHAGLDGSIDGFYVMITDVTERKNAEQELQRSEHRLRDNERRLRLVTDSLPALVAHIDLRGRYTFANAHFQRVFGLDPASLLGHRVTDLQGQMDLGDIDKLLQRALAGEAFSAENDCETPTGPHYYQSNFVPDVDDDGQVRGVYLMGSDFTGRKLAELALARQEHMLRTITDNLPVLISYSDAGHKVQFLNATGRSWMGVATGDPLNRHLAEVIGPERYQQRQAFLDRALAGERTEFEIETQLQGGPRDLHHTYIPDQRADGSVVGVFTMTIDISASKATQRQLDELARVDVLTDLPNRRQFGEKLSDALLRSKRDQTPIALVFLDIDHFKAINDSLGHAGGDAVLREFGSRLRSTVRATDVAARLAGDEFVVLLEGVTTQAECEVVAQKIVHTMRVPFAIDSQARPVTVSLGVAFAPDGSVSAEQLLATADQALYAVKHAGRNGYALRLCELDDSLV